MLETLKQQVLEANLELVRKRLVILTWGNVSGLSREKGLVVIKPSGVPYEQLRAENMVVVDLEGRLVEGRLRPSSDTPTHLQLYRHFDCIGGVVHTHSPFATIFAQAHRSIPCFGTTHADHFAGPVPLTRQLTREEVAGDYEGNTGKVIVEAMAKQNPAEVPGILVAGHGPFAWGSSPQKAVENAFILESIAFMAYHTLLLNPEQESLVEYIRKKHYERKHGKNAYYGQSRKENKDA